MTRLDSVANPWQAPSSIPSLLPRWIRPPGKSAYIDHALGPRPVLRGRDLVDDRSHGRLDRLIGELRLTRELDAVSPLRRRVLLAGRAAAAGRDDRQQELGQDPSAHRFAPPRECRARRSSGRRPNWPHPVWRRRPDDARHHDLALMASTAARPRYNESEGRERPGDREPRRRTLPRRPARTCGRADQNRSTEKGRPTNDACNHDPAPVPRPRRADPRPAGLAWAAGRPGRWSTTTRPKARRPNRPPPRS